MRINNLIILCALILVLSPELMADEDDNTKRLMTFFTTRGERNTLDDMRNAGKFDKDRVVKVSEDLSLQEPDKIEVKGIMLREKGEPVVWINKGNTLKSNQIDQQISVKTRSIKKEHLKIPVKVGHKRISMKPGQQWNESDNKIQDKYQTK